jgi:hypothetical protein
MTPRGLLLRAALISIVYGLLHLAGGRHYAGFLSGTPVGGMGAIAFGCSYVVMHFAFVILAPILAISSLLMSLLPRRVR